MTPEEKVRKDIDRQLEQSGWLVQDRSEMHILAALGVVIRELSMITGEADYLLYAGGKAIGVVQVDCRGHSIHRPFWYTLLAELSDLVQARSHDKRQGK